MPNNLKRQDTSPNKQIRMNKWNQVIKLEFEIQELRKWVTVDETSFIKQFSQTPHRKGISGVQF